MLKLNIALTIFFIIFLHHQYVNCEEQQRVDKYIPTLKVLLQGTYTYSAWSNKTIYQFFNIPFAEPPLGNQYRFQKAKEKTAFNSIIYNATEPGLRCPTPDIVANFPNNWTENCLHLTVYTTNHNSSAKLPVLLYVHGGGFDDGQSVKNGQLPHHLLDKDMVLATIEYRLGPLGFLSLKTPKIPGNAGIHDTILGIKWVKKHIQHFGGNPNQITLFGESAGAAIISALMFSPAVPENYFQGAILQSGTFFLPNMFDMDPIKSATTMYNLANKTSCTKPNDMESCLLEIDVAELIKAYGKFKKINAATGLTGCGLTQGELFPFLPSDALSGVIPMKNINLISGVTKHDGMSMGVGLYEIFKLVFNAETNSTFNTYDMIDMTVKSIGVDDFTGTFKSFLIKKLYTQEEIVRGNLTEMLPGFKDILCDIMFKAPALKAAQAHAKFFPKKTYMYSIDYRGQYSKGDKLDPNSPFYVGVHHADDKFYTFYNPETPLNEADTKVAKLFVDLWTSFATNGIPLSKNAPKWPTFEKYTGPYLHITDKSYVGKDFLDELSIISKEARNA